MQDRISTSPNPVLQMVEICKAFGGNQVLRALSFSLQQGSVTALIGSNGAGKSTALNILSGLVQQDSGRIVLNSKVISDLPAYQRSRQGVARTFQQPRSFQTLTSLEAVCLAQTLPSAESLGSSIIQSGAFWRSARHDFDRASTHLERCCLGDRGHAIAAELSYGEQKLLMLAQALAFGAELYCFDELCAGLQPTLIDHVAEVVQSLAGSGKTILFVEHNLDLVRRIADFTIFLHEGRVFREGATDEVLSDPSVVQLYLGD
jgi:ABC-type branched-subunit amino acid transport system ATPase component